MRRAWLVLAAMWLAPIAASAQASPETEASPAAEPAAATEGAASATEGAAAAEPALRDPEPAIAPKVALVVVGDPDAVLQAATLEVEAQLTLDGSLRIPADAALRSALRGDAGAAEDGLDEVRRERRRLGLGEASDAPILQVLGRRAGAVLVIAVREGPAGPEALALDVSSGRFFEGTLPLAEPASDAVLSFVTRRARVAARGVSEPAAAPAPTPAATPDLSPPTTVPTAATQADAPAAEPDWFEQNWPYLAAGVLLAGAIVFVVVAATDGGDAPPMLRFQPGTP